MSLRPIGLRDAFELYCNAHISDFMDRMNEARADADKRPVAAAPDMALSEETGQRIKTFQAKLRFEKPDQSDDEEPTYDEYTFAEWDKAVRQAELDFRAELTQLAAPRAYVLHPASGAEIPLDRLEWTDGKCFVPGFSSDYLDGKFVPGPKQAFVAGHWQQVLFIGDSFRGYFLGGDVPPPSLPEMQFRKRLPVEVPTGRMVGPVWAAAYKVEGWAQYGFPSDLPVRKLIEMIKPRMRKQAAGEEPIILAPSTVRRALGLDE